MVAPPRQHVGPARTATGAALSEHHILLADSLIPVATFESTFTPGIGQVHRKRRYDDEGNPLPWEYLGDPRDVDSDGEPC